MGRNLPLDPQVTMGRQAISTEGFAVILQFQSESGWCSFASLKSGAGRCLTTDRRLTKTSAKEARKWLSPILAGCSGGVSVWTATTRTLIRPQNHGASKPSASKSDPRGRDLHNPLTDFTRRLEVISAVAVTAEVALRAQNCEQDADIALWLLPREGTRRMYLEKWRTGSDSSCGESHVIPWRLPKGSAIKIRLLRWFQRRWATGFVKATSNPARPFPRTGEIAIFANFTKSTGSFPPFFFCLFNLLRMVRLLHLELLRERYVPSRNRRRNYVLGSQKGVN
jgi:hypothetical protein